MNPTGIQRRKDVISMWYASSKIKDLPSMVRKIHSADQIYFIILYMYMPKDYHFPLTTFPD